ncbi:MAG: hypothetical protein WCC22_07150 [Terriglobales bacterium]
MCATVLAPQVTLTTPFVVAAQYQDSNFRRVEHARDRKRPLSMKWVVVIDEHGNRRLRMHWTGALPPTLGKATLPCVEPALGRVYGPNPSPKIEYRFLNLSRQGK